MAHSNIVEFEGKTLEEQLTFIGNHSRIHWNKGEGLLIGTYGEGVDPMYIVNEDREHISFEPIDHRYQTYEFSGEKDLEKAVTWFVNDVLHIDEDGDNLFGCFYHGSRGLTQYLINRDCYCYWLEVMQPRLHSDTALDMLRMAAERLGLNIEIKGYHYNGLLTEHPTNGNKIKIGHSDMYKTDFTSSFSDSMTFELSKKHK